MKPHLRPAERRTLEVLRRAGGLVIYEELTTALYGADHLASDRDIPKTFIYRLRRKGYAIETVKGVGYILGENPPCPMCGREMQA